MSDFLITVMYTPFSLDVDNLGLRLPVALFDSLILAFEFHSSDGLVIRPLELKRCHCFELKRPYPKFPAPSSKLHASQLPVIITPTKPSVLAS